MCRQRRYEGDKGVPAGGESNCIGVRHRAGEASGAAGGGGRGSCARMCSLKCIQSWVTPAVAQVVSARSVRCPSFSIQSWRAGPRAMRRCGDQGPVHSCPPRMKSVRMPRPVRSACAARTEPPHRGVIRRSCSPTRSLRFAHSFAVRRRAGPAEGPYLREPAVGVAPVQLCGAAVRLKKAGVWEGGVRSEVGSRALIGVVRRGGCPCGHGR